MRPEYNPGAFGLFKSGNSQLMRNRSSLAIIIPLLIVCFAAGVLSVLIKPPGNENLPTATPSSSSLVFPTPTKASRVTVIVFGVDELDLKSSGTLLTTWLITFGSKQQAVELTGLAHDTTLPDGRTLREAFSLFEPPDFGASLISSLSTFTEFPIQGFVVLDQIGFAALIDYLGGFTLGDQTYDGSRALVALGLLENSPHESLKLQVQILQAMVESAQALGRTPEITPLTTLVPDHAFTSPGAAQLATMAIPLLPIEPDRVTVQTWSG
jgi:energy-converting hydrogenase Eha subunit A